jgi:hypothetical protein
MEEIEKDNELEYSHASKTGKFLEYDESEFKVEEKRPSTISIILKSTLSFFLILVLIFQILAVFTPHVIGKAFFTFGMSNASGYFYHEAYKKNKGSSKSIYYLANSYENYVIGKNHQKVTFIYPNELKVHEGYMDMCKKVNSDNADNIYSLIVSFNYDNYLKSKYVESLFISGQIQGAFQFAFEQELGALMLAYKVEDINLYLDLSQGVFKYSFVLSSFIIAMSDTNNEYAKELFRANISTLPSYDSSIPIDSNMKNYERLDEIVFNQVQDMKTKHTNLNNHSMYVSLSEMQRKLGRADIKNRGLEICSSMWLLYTNLGLSEKVDIWQAQYTNFWNMNVL